MIITVKERGQYVQKEVEREFLCWGCEDCLVDIPYALCANCLTSNADDWVHAEDWQKVDEYQSHMRAIAALSDAIAITKAEQDGWEIDFYCADRKRLM